MVGAVQTRMVQFNFAFTGGKKCLCGYVALTIYCCCVYSRNVSHDCILNSPVCFNNYWQVLKSEFLMRWLLSNVSLVHLESKQHLLFGWCRLYLNNSFCTLGRTNYWLMRVTNSIWCLLHCKLNTFAIRLSSGFVWYLND